MERYNIQAQLLIFLAFAGFVIGVGMLRSHQLSEVRADLLAHCSENVRVIVYYRDHKYDCAWLKGSEDD